MAKSHFDPEPVFSAIQSKLGYALRGTTMLLNVTPILAALRGRAKNLNPIFPYLRLG